jgi:AraC-like DNA-binding protein
VELSNNSPFTIHHSQLSPRITCINVNDVPRYDNLSTKLELSHDQNNLCFNFSAFAFNDMSSVVYSYWLEGIDSDWRPSTKESQALYTNLSPGHYRLHVRSRLAGTTWSEETVCEVIIAQPWYWTWWARILYLLIIALFIWYEWHQYQQRLSLRRQLDQRLTALYAVEVQQEPEEKPQPQEKSQESEIAKVTKETTSTNQKDKDFLTKLDHLILTNLLQTDLDVNFLAQEMCVSYSTLHRRIKSLTGLSANEYVRKHRLIKAMQLLRDGLNATEVSMQCGFNSPSYFTRCFKAEYGILPSEV